MSRTPFVVVVMMVVAGCARQPALTRTDVDAYLRRTEDWAPVEAETAQTIERILRTQFVDEAEVRRQIAQSRPRIAEHLERVRTYTPRSAELATVHRRYVAAWDALLAGYDAIEQGFSSGDYSLLARGRNGMAEWRQELIQVAGELRTLRQSVGADGEGITESRAGSPQLSTHST